MITDRSVLPLITERSICRYIYIYIYITLDSTVSPLHKKCAVGPHLIACCSRCARMFVFWSFGPYLCASTSQDVKYANITQIKKFEV